MGVPEIRRAKRAEKIFEVLLVFTVEFKRIGARSAPDILLGVFCTGIKNFAHGSQFSGNDVI